MGGVGSPKQQLLYALQFLLLLIHTKDVLCSQYKVGDLDSWGIPTSTNPNVYTYWAEFHNLTIGDSLLFLYPPSQDSVIQVTAQSYDSCNITNPIVLMNNGNSVFNITGPGDSYFTSGAQGSCQKSQKLHISMAGVWTSAPAPPQGPTAAAPSSYPTVFGSIPMSPLSSPMAPLSAPLSSPSSSSSIRSPVILLSAAIGLLICALVMN